MPYAPSGSNRRGRSVGNVDEREFKTCQNGFSDLYWYADNTKRNEKLVVVL
jgi:hypothetical protein